MDEKLLNLLFYNERTIRFLNAKGLISDDGFARIEIYRYFNSLIKSGETKGNAYALTAQKFCKSVDRVQSIIYELNKQKDDVPAID